MGSVGESFAGLFDLLLSKIGGHPFGNLGITLPEAQFGSTLVEDDAGSVVPVDFVELGDVLCSRINP